MLVCNERFVFADIKGLGSEKPWSRLFPPPSRPTNRLPNPHGKKRVIAGFPLVRCSGLEGWDQRCLQPSPL